jgi:hypothetical protein
MRDHHVNDFVHRTCIVDTSVQDSDRFAVEDECVTSDDF